MRKMLEEDGQLIHRQIEETLGLNVHEIRSTCTLQNFVVRDNFCMRTTSIWRDISIVLRSDDQVLKQILSH